MPSTGVSKANENKAIRQEALREQLSNQKHVEHVIDISDKLKDLGNELTQVETTRLKAAADLKLKLINKYLPDLKAVELIADVEIDGELHFTWQR